MTIKTQISIIGCGWLGLPLAEFLIAKDYKIIGSTTSIDKLKILNEAGIESFLIQLNEDGITGNHSEFLAESETVIVNIPPGLRKHPLKNHILEIKHLITAIERAQVKNVIYISSTSVFKDEAHFPKIDDTSTPTATSNNAKQLIKIEQMLQENPKFNTTILRFGGLFDDKRHPAKYLSGKKSIANPNAPINLIHKKDCIHIISEIVGNNIWNTSLNAAYPDHPSKETYYSAYCKDHGLELPKFDSTRKSMGKIIDSSKLEQLLNYSFKQAL
ncbi:NAD(P)H-binding protein [Winogradskyella flava]|uniref:NAD(P)H-binding protein n=1 Tax=Winogradskyella flava TaxID=1884876 RepID=A0A842IM59_9FLAO|nr:NAD(P)H-binding protein [Winogradskyella flava]MBC2843725.1 NAD(P)H-binding protein [Winogradskyella flava]